MMPIRRHQRKPENYGVSAWDGEPQLIFPPVSAPANPCPVRRCWRDRSYRMAVPDSEWLTAAPSGRGFAPA